MKTSTVLLSLIVVLLLIIIGIGGTILWRDYQAKEANQSSDFQTRARDANLANNDQIDFRCRTQVPNHTDYSETGGAGDYVKCLRDNGYEFVTITPES